MNQTLEGLVPKAAFAAAALIACCAGKSVGGSMDPCFIIPLPEKVEKRNGAFRVWPNTQIILEAAPHQLGDYLSDEPLTRPRPS